jgi:hypothetical protein
LEYFTNQASDIAVELANLDFTVTALFIIIVTLSCFVVIAGVMLGSWHFFRSKRAGEVPLEPSEDQVTWTSIMRQLR